LTERLHHPAERVPHRDRGDAGAAIGLGRPLGRGRGAARDARPERHRAFPGAYGLQGHAAQRLQIAEEIEDVGGYINAYTSREMTAYYARVLSGDVPLALDVIPTSC
jgi:hypothetical protein